MNRIRNVISGLLGLVVLAGLVVGLAWLLGPQGTLPAQQVSPLRTPTRPATTPAPVETPTPWLSPTPRLTPTPRPTPTPWPTPDFTGIPTPTPLPEGTFGILYVTQPLEKPFTEGAVIHALVYNPSADVVVGQHTIVPRCWDLAHYPASDLSLSPDRRYIAIQTLNQDGYGFMACVTSLDGRQSTMLDPPGEVGSQFLGWIPGSDAALVEAGLVGIMSLDTGMFQDLPVHSPASGAVSPAGRIVLVDVDRFKFALPDGTIYNDVLIPDPSLAGGSPQELTWAPDGGSLAYAAGITPKLQLRGSNTGIWVMNAESGDARLVSAIEGLDYAPAWSPDSRMLVYVREEYHDPSLWSYHDLSQSPSSIWIVDVTTGQGREVLAAEGYLHWNPVWLPDGSAIVFVSNRGGGNDLWLMWPDGSGLRQLTDDGNVVARPITFR